ncbi:MAG: helix-turn-helix domain-containing protein [Chloroflexota bacterium]
MVTVDKAMVGRRIRALRLSRGLTQVGLADRLHVTGQAISKWEKGYALPDTAILPALAGILGTSIDGLLMTQGLAAAAGTSGQDRVRRLPGFTWLPGSILMGGCVKSCLRFLGISISDAWVSGGYAFILNISRNVTMAGPESWPDAGMLDRLTEDYGGVHERIQALRRDSAFREAQALAWAKIRSAIDKGLPCFGWELDQPYWYIINGYDDIGYYFMGPGREAGAGPKPWTELGDSAWGVLEVHIIRPGHIADNLKTIRDVLVLALEHAGRQASGPDGDLTGSAGYEHWIEAIEAGTGDSHGLAFNAAFYARARELAVEFLAEARQRTGDAFPTLFREAIEAYQAVSTALSDLARLFPLPGNDDWRSDQPCRRAAVGHLRDAMAAEAAGRAVMARLLAAIDRVW